MLWFDLFYFFFFSFILSSDLPSIRYQSNSLLEETIKQENESWVKVQRKLILTRQRMKPIKRFSPFFFEYIRLQTTILSRDINNLLFGLFSLHLSLCLFNFIFSLFFSYCVKLDWGLEERSTLDVLLHLCITIIIIIMIILWIVFFFSPSSSL